MLDFYIVVTAEGKLRIQRTYTRYKNAENAAVYEGDSVVQVAVSSETKPVFIRRFKLEG